MSCIMWFDGASVGRAGSIDSDTRKLVASLQECRAIESETKRLACFDRLARHNSPPRYVGKLGFKTEPFKLDQPYRLRYQSAGVIFVLYVLDEKGSVVQNLHIGGGGEDTYLIEKPGIYSLQIDGSARWKIWLEPV